MLWQHRKDGDPAGFALYRRHYSAAKNPNPKIRQFVGPGEKMVLMTVANDALFAWRKFIDHGAGGQHGVNCAVFRNESSHLSSDLIREAMGLAWERWPGQRLYTYVSAVATAKRRGKANPPGFCFLKAGWRECGSTKKGLLVLECYP